MKCQREGCGVAIRNRPNAKYCEPCRQIMRDETNARHNEVKKIGQRSARIELKIIKARPRKSSISDADQVALNKAVDDRYAVMTVTTSPKKGTPEWDAIAAQCTQPHRIKDASFMRTPIFEEPTPYKVGQHHESSEEI